MAYYLSSISFTYTQSRNPKSEIYPEIPGTLVNNSTIHVLNSKTLTEDPIFSTTQVNPSSPSSEDVPVQGQRVHVSK